MAFRSERRRFLRGMGTTLALPLLDYFLPRGRVYADDSPLRVIYLYLGNGAQWQPSSVGANFTLPSALTDLAPLVDYLTVVSGLSNRPAMARQSGDHARGCAGFLTGETAANPGPMIGRSIDLLIADQIGQKTRYSNLCLGGEPKGESESGYVADYQNHISWLGGSSPNTRELDPVAIFNRMFSGGSAEQQRSQQGQRQEGGKSVLDFVRAEASSLGAVLGQGDKSRLQEYLQSVRDLEVRLGKTGAASAGCQSLTPPISAAPYHEKIGLLYDVLYHALVCNMTNVATFIVASETSEQSYDLVGVPGSHHSISHDASEQGHGKIARIAKWHIARFSELCLRLKATSEGSGNLLDHSILVFGAGIGDGSKHDHVNLPIAVIGKGGGAIPGARHLRYDGTPLCNLHLAVASAAGVPLRKFGDSTGVLSWT